MLASANQSVPDAANDRVQWLVADHLGTPRIIADLSGSLAGMTRHDYLPFGEEIKAGTGGRTEQHGYSQPDGVRFQWTGKERDGESELDYFLARYYANQQGRFTSPDPLLSSGSVSNPQTWNRYTQAINNPLKYTDPFGMYICHGNKEQCKDVEKGLKGLEKARDSFKKGSNEYNSLDRSRKAYGANGVDNGVSIQFGKTRTGAPATTTISPKLDTSSANKLVTTDNPNGQDITVTIDPTRTDTAADFVLNLGHEGSHVADGAALIGALPIEDLGSSAANKVLAGSLNLTLYASETRAYEADSYIAEALGLKSLSMGKAQNEIWNSGWSQADKATKRAAGIERVLATPKNKGGLHEVTPVNPGPKIMQ
jgi:RHS repeat-associated protein